MFRASKLCQGSSTSGPSATREAQPAHDLLQLVDRLRDRVQMAQPRADAGHRGIELAGRRPPGRGRGQPLDGRLEGRLDRLLDLVEPLAGGRLVGLIDRAEALLHGLQPAALRAEELDPRGFQRRRHRRPPKAHSASAAVDRVRPGIRRVPSSCLVPILGGQRPECGLQSATGRSQFLDRHQL